MMSENVGIHTWKEIIELVELAWQAPVLDVEAMLLINKCTLKQILTKLSQEDKDA